MSQRCQILQAIGGLKARQVDLDGAAVRWRRPGRLADDALDGWT
jgi:hypothetical protein